MKTYYEMLSVEATASTDDIKKAFRREIARYHPDKVQHLGREFQDMAAGIAASLTEAYRVLMDPALRARYDEDLKSGADSPERARAAPPSRAPQSPAQPHPRNSVAQPPPAAPPRAAAAASLDFVRKATVSKVKEAINATTEAVSTPASGFDAAYVIKPKKGLFKKSEPGVRLLVKIVPQVDAAAVQECWPLALKATVPDTTLTLLLIGSGMAEPRVLAAAVTEQRRRARGAGPVLVPVDVRDWEALTPPDTPDSVRAVLKRLNTGK